MRYQCMFALGLILLLCSCGESDPEGVLGEWKGTIPTVNNEGEAVLSSTDVNITSAGSTSYNCILNIAGASYEFEAQDSKDGLLYDRTIVNNLSDSMITTYIDGSATLVGDTLLIFEHEIFKMKGSSVLSFQDYMFEMKRD